jgi:gamma-glutamyltranspeptidase/glutathione hydrolase
MLEGQNAHGHLGREDFAAFQVHWREPLQVQAGTGRAWLNPPPAASGALIALAQQSLAPDAACAPCAWARALDAADCARHDCGHDLSALMARLGPPAHRGTTHISTLGADGMACAMTISNGEGNGHIVPGFGFMLNNMLGEADVNPAGALGWPLDARLSSMMAPTLARAEDGALYVLGSGGSNRIRSVIFLMLERLLGQNMPLAAAVEAPRLHVEAGHLDFEPGFSRDEAKALAAAFPDHRAWDEKSLFFGGCHAAARAPDGTLSAFGDPRRAGAAALAE